MSQKEIPRVGLLKAAVRGKITNAEGAKALSISVRQFQRLKILFAEGGMVALQHRSRGRPSPRRTDNRQRGVILRLIQTTYQGLNDCHLTEKLKEVEKIVVSREFIRRLRLSIGVQAKRRRRPPQHRIRRLREAREGAMVQTDGSYHDWLQGRGPWMCLVGVVDDASGKILGGTFRPREDLHGYATAFHQMFTTYGLPLAVYGDGTNILVRNDQSWTLDEELEGKRFPTHLGRVLKDLGIRYIQAHSPQAKGRVENLWSVLQDRLVSELRLKGICTLNVANNYLPAFITDFNKRFAKAPRDLTVIWRRYPKNLDTILSCRYLRVVSRDNVVSLGAHHKDDRYRGSLSHDHPTVRPVAPPEIHLPKGPGGRSWARYKIEIRELLDGRMLALYKGALIASTPKQGKDFVLASRNARRLKGDTSTAPNTTVRIAVPTKRKRQLPPPANHPWRRMSF